MCLQCVPAENVCDGVKQCVDDSDEITCEPRVGDLDLMMSTPPPPAVVTFTTSGTLTIASLNASDATCPHTHFWCPGKDYCLPVYVRCNGVYDCPNHEDEEMCDSYRCPGFYRCRNSPICVHAEHVCDGVFQCPERDDELTCGMTCPESCECSGLAFLCVGKVQAKHYPGLRYLNADGTGLRLHDVSSNRLLIHLSLKNCGIIDTDSVHLPNLKNLDLSYNSLSKITGIRMANLHDLDLSHNSLSVFTGAGFPSLTNLDLSYNALTDTLWAEIALLQNLRKLSIGYNNIQAAISTTDKLLFSDVITVDLSGLTIKELSGTFLQIFPNAEYLNLSGSKVEKVSKNGFNQLPQLKVLDLTGCPMMEFSKDVFRGLENIETIVTDNYRLCCPGILPRGFCSDKCYSPDDEISSCDALLRADIFRLFLIVYALLALVGSFLYTVCCKKPAKKQLGFDIFVTPLCVSDFLMGVYLAIIGVADRWYHGTYEWNDITWTHSAMCQLAGFLSFVSNEVSAFLICLITLERLLSVRFPHKNLNFKARSANIASFAGWLVGVVLAAVPLLRFTEHWEFYSQTGICIPLPITRKVFPGSDYSFLVVIIVNLILFLLVALGQLLIFWSYRSHSKAVRSCGRRAKDAAIARRLLIVAMSDFLCWFPLGLLALMARSGVAISGKVYVAMAIFVLPFNSAVNPLLYTLPMVREHRRQAKTNRQQQLQHSSRSEPQLQDTAIQTE